MYYLILAIITIIVIVLGAKTNLLKDIVYSKDDLAKNAAIANIKDPVAPFSWSRTQLAYWTAIIFSSFLYLLFKYNFEIPELNQVNLVLLGITAATTASGKLIDDSQKLNPDLSQSYPSEGFLRDILSDKNGVSIYRLQNLLWTVAVGIIYIQNVASLGSLPDESVLTTNLLMLMGISTGAYVGLKTTENSK